jgi:hypothetical protein
MRRGRSFVSGVVAGAGMGVPGGRGSGDARRKTFIGIGVTSPPTICGDTGAHSGNRTTFFFGEFLSLLHHQGRIVRVYLVEFFLCSSNARRSCSGLPVMRGGGGGYLNSGALMLHL